MLFNLVNVTSLVFAYYPTSTFVSDRLAVFLIGIALLIGVEGKRSSVQEMGKRL